MSYKYEHLIPNNIAPDGAKKIGVYEKIETTVNGETKITYEKKFDIPLGGLTPPSRKPLYSFGLVSDCHTYNKATNHGGNNKLRNALTYFQSQGCIMTIGCGDFTQTGFYHKNDSSTTTITVIGTTVIPNRPDFTVPPRTTYYDESQMVSYKDIVDKFSMPVYEIFGNHENYNNKSMTSETTIEGVVYKSLDRVKYLIGIPATAYTLSSSPDTDTTERPNRQVKKNNGENINDLFILIGQSESAKPMSTDDLAWLKNILGKEENKNRRCFIFIHSFIDDDWNDKTHAIRDVERPKEDDPAQDNEGGLINFSDSGNPCGARGNSIVGWWEDYAPSTLTDFLNTLKQYPNAIIFHGHSHMKFESQEFDPCANYTDKNGFKSVHVPSLGSPRRLLNTDGDWDVVTTDGYTQPESQCYRVDVYEDCIILNGLSFSGTTATPVPLGTYKIYTTLQTVESGTLVNDDGILSLSGEALTVDSDGIIDLRSQNYEY